MNNDTVIKEAVPEKTLLYSSGLLFEEENEEIVSTDLRQKAYLQGRDEGELIGYEKGQKEFAQLLPLLRSIANKLLEKKEELIMEVKREVVELALAVSEKILRSELAQKEKFAKLIDSYLSFDSASFQKENVKVFLAPEDLLMLQSYFEEAVYDKKEIEEISFLPDSHLQRGDFRIVTKTALLNCTLARQLDDLRAKVLQP